MFRNQVIRLWALVYDQDADRVYTFTDWNNVLRSVDGSIRTYLGEDGQQIEYLVKSIMVELQEWHWRAFIPIKVNNLVIMIYRWEIDPSNPIHKMLSRCYEQVDDTLKLEIVDLFTNPR